ncbi:hypothetical protein CPB84DRAFT_1846175 [Gymnopilus junonius]|uniref:Uncharacterized protein n=1 Tax=Gymnopilus junonius TaxID=109634 RepID=A0A9P5TQ32_GYMJU|nr:hypothetical protein CPB84DRAFT_1846175 [Gymnopilus junonius]
MARRALRRRPLRRSPLAVLEGWQAETNQLISPSKNGERRTHLSCRTSMAFERAVGAVPPVTDSN